MVKYIHLGNEIVYISATFDVTNVSNTVEVDLWFSTSLDLGMNLSSELAAMSMSYTVDHANKPLFTPRIATFSCLDCGDDFKKVHCMSEGVFCAYTPNFYQEYDLQAKGVSMTGKEVLMQALREKCLHKLMSNKYQDEGDLYWTFFSYLGKCFGSNKEDFMMLTNKDLPKSLDECYDWSTVQIQNVEEVGTINQCVEESFAVHGDLESENYILREDRNWA